MKKLRLSILAVLIAALLATVIAAAAGVYDSANDPILTVSGMVKWLEENFRPSINTAITDGLTPVERSMEEMQIALEAANAKIVELQTQLGEQSGSTSGYEVIYLTAGTELSATGICDLILRSGSAVVVSPFTGSNAQGLSDLTTGSDLLNGAEIPTNHHLIVPRGGDGRGIKITSDGGAYLLVQGGYSLVQP